MHNKNKSAAIPKLDLTKLKRDFEITEESEEPDHQQILSEDMVVVDDLKIHEYSEGQSSSDYYDHHPVPNVMTHHPNKVKLLLSDINKLDLSYPDIDGSDLDSLRDIVPHKET